MMVVGGIFMWLRSVLFSCILAFAYLGAFTHCGGGSSVDLSGESSAIGGNEQSGDDDDSSEEATSSFTSETVEDDEVVQSAEAGAVGDNNEAEVVNAPELGYVTETLVYLDCCIADTLDADEDDDIEECTRTAAGDPETDYVSLGCTQGESTITYNYYCTSSIDAEENEIFLITRDTDDDPVVTEELFGTILVTCQEAEDGSAELFEEEYIVS